MLCKSAASKHQLKRQRPTCLWLKRENPAWDKEKELIVLDHTGQSPPAVTDLNLLRCPSNEPLSGNSPYRSICLPFFSVLSPGDSVHKNVFARCSIQYVETASPEAKYIYRSLFKFCMMWNNCIFLFCASSELENFFNVSRWFCCTFND